MNLMERIEEQIRTDDEDSEEKSSRLIDTYASATVKGRELIDEVFMTLTGWRLETLMNPPWEKGGNRERKTKMAD